MSTLTLLRPLPIGKVAAEVDGLRLVETERGSVLLHSTQTCRSPSLGLNDCEMTIRAVSIAEPNRPTCVAVVSRPLPPPPRWDARPSGLDRYDIVYDEAGGALFRLLMLDGSGQLASLSAAYPFQSFHSPRFVRCRAIIKQAE